MSDAADEDDFGPVPRRSSLISSLVFATTTRPATDSVIRTTTTHETSLIEAESIMAEQASALADSASASLRQLADTSSMQPLALPESLPQSIQSKEPAHSEGPGQSEGPVHFEGPSQAEEPAHFEEPVHSEEPVHFEEPAQSEGPAQSERAAQSDEPASKISLQILSPAVGDQALNEFQQAGDTATVELQHPVAYVAPVPASVQQDEYTDACENAVMSSALQQAAIPREHGRTASLVLASTVEEPRSTSVQVSSLWVAWACHP